MPERVWDSSFATSVNNTLFIEPVLKKSGVKVDE
jgi:hypothetical protein